VRLAAPKSQGPADAELIEGVRRRLWLAAIVANVCGSVDLFLFTGLLVYGAAKPADTTTFTVVNAVAGAFYVAITLVIGRAWGRRAMGGVEPWMVSGRQPTADERRDALRLPIVQAWIYGLFWTIGAALFALINAAIVSPTVGAIVLVTVLLGGVTTTAIGYLMAERILRPVTACALADSPPERPVGPGVGQRVITVWGLATGVPLLGMAAVAVAGLLGTHFDRTLLAASILFLAVLSIGVGLLATKLGARSLSEPLGEMRKALGRIEQGEFGARVAVDDGSEMGLLEAGFNRMASGLQEREQLQDLFGRHVGEEVARAALDGGVQLGGEVRVVAILFVDLVGSTALAASLPPAQVVALLNDFFELVFDVVKSHGGMVNKFEGDGALCVFGAPVPLDDPAGAALAAARELRARLLDELPELDAGIGVSAGEAVAGNVGAQERFEYTVIGDPVNQAARLCEIAKRTPERVVVSATAVAMASPLEAARWSLGESTVLRGRDTPTQLATAAAPPRVPALPD
jgi:adenylate cyclase